MNLLKKVGEYESGLQPLLNLDAVGRGRPYARSRSKLARVPERSSDSFIVAEQNRELVAKLREGGVTAVLIQAHIARAHLLVIATPDTFNARRMIVELIGRRGAKRCRYPTATLLGGLVERGVRPRGR